MDGVHCETVHVLLRAGANTNAKDFEGHGALWHVKQRNNAVETAALKRIGAHE